LAGSIVETALRGASHPLDPLGADEIARAVEIMRGDERVPEGVLFANITLAEPPKDVVRSFVPGTPLDRRVDLVLVLGPEASVVRSEVSLATGEVTRFEHVPEARPALLFEESLLAIVALKQDPAWQEAMRRRGITDFDKVQVDPWPAGCFGLAHEDGRRITRALSFLRDEPADNGYAKPIEGVVGFVDMARGEVLEVVDHGVVPVPKRKGNYHAADVGPLRDDLRPLEISQPEGPSFTVEGNLVRWQRWSMRVSLDPLEGLVLHTVGYEDQGRVRPIAHRMSVSEMVVPYGHPGATHGWKNAFDAGEWGLGRMTQPLSLGCDCLGEIHYFDAVLCNERGAPYTVENAICMHEEDYGISWKHVDLQGGTSEVRRSRRLVVSHIATVGNYEYGFYWYFYLDGSIQLEVKLTGILSTMAVEPGAQISHAERVTPELAGPNHQHLFNVRLDLDIDGTPNSVYEVDVVADPPGPGNPMGNAFSAEARLLETELEARRDVDPGASRVWKIVNPSVRNSVGEPVGYKLVPGPTPKLLARPGSSVHERAGFARHNLWVTPFSPDERRAAGDYPNQHRGGDGLPRWTAADRSVAGGDVVLWHTFGVTHIVRPEDWPVMPVEYTGFWLVPFGFFDRNPALDVPPAGGHCSGNGAGSGSGSGGG
jgi:primary-amine oxidase